MNKKQLESTWFNKTAKAEGLDRFIKEIKDKTMLYAGSGQTRFWVKGDRIYMQMRSMMYSSVGDYWFFVTTNHKNAVRNIKKYVKDEVKKIGLQSKVEITRLEKIDSEDAGFYEEFDGYVEVGDFDLLLEIELPKYMRTATLKEIAKKLKGKGHYTKIDGDQLVVEFKSDALGKWEYRCWSMNKTEYQDANNKLHQEFAKTLKGMYPKHQVTAENGYNEMGWAYAYIKMP